MEKQIQVCYNYVAENFKELIVVGAIMVSAIIVFIGLMKPLFFNRIKWKPLRKFALAISTIAFSFVSTACYYLIEQIHDWEYYVYSSVGVSLLCIITYWLYENTCLRDLIDKIGNMAVKKFINIVTMIFNDKEKKEIEAEVEKVKAELKSTAKLEIKKATKSAKKDKELENL